METTKQATVSNTTASNKGRELFGNWELEDELDDADLRVVAGGLAKVNVAVSIAFVALAV